MRRPISLVAIFALYPQGGGKNRLWAMERDKIISSHDHLHAFVVSNNGGDKDSSEQTIDKLSLFWRMLEWMEIEGAIIKSYDELADPVSGKTKLFKKHELKTVDRVLEEVDRIVGELMGTFFKEFNFAIGVLNSLLVVYVFAAYPQHFWLLYLVEGLFLLPRNLYLRVRAKPLSRLLR